MPNDPSQDKDFLAASPEDQHAYLMHSDQNYAKASPEDQKSYIAHVTGKSPSTQPGAFQAKKGGQVYTDEVKYLKDQKDTEKGSAAAAEEATGKIAPGGELGVGAAKGAMSTARNLGGLGIKAVKYFAPQFGNKLEEAWPEAVNGPGEAMRPQSTAAKIGFGAEQGAEFAVPGGAVSKAAKAADAGIDAMKAAPFLSKAMKVLTRSGLEGASGGGVAAAQGQDPKSAAMFSAAMPIAGAALKPVAKALAEKAAPALANKLLRPVPTQLEKAARFGRNPGQAVADEGIIATSHEDLVNKIAEKKDMVGQIIGDHLKAAAKSGKTIDARAAIEQPINEAVQDVVSGKVEGGQAMIDKLEELRHTLTSERRLVNGKLEVAGPKNLTVPPTEAHALKRQIGDSAKWSEDQTTQALNDVKRSIYRNLNDEVQKAVPTVKMHQDRYGNLLEAEKAAEREAARHAARNPFSLSDILTAMGGASMGAATHGDFLHSAVGAAAGGLGSKALKSPLLKTVGVQALKKPEDWLKSPETMRAVRNALFGARSANQQ